MGNALSSYFQAHKLPPHTTAEQAAKSDENQIKMSHLLKLAAASALGFFLVSRGATMMAKQSEWYWKLNVVKRRRLPTYVTSLVHATITASFAWYKTTRRPADDHTGNRRMLAMSLGYFVNDLVETMPDWIAHPQDLVHHLCGILVIGGAISQSSVTDFIPRFFVVESSTVFLDLMWLLKESGNKATSLYRFSSLSFASLFFVSRVLWFPYAVLDVAYGSPKKWKKLGLARLGLYPLAALQFYWFYRIVLMLRK